MYSCSNSPEPVDLVITNVNIIDLETGEILNGQSVFIAGDSIFRIEKTEAGNLQKALIEIDGTDKYLTTGFWDNHAHFRGGDSLIAENKHLHNLFIANGITTVRDAGGDLTRAVQNWQQEMAEGTLIGPTIYTSGPKIDGPDATWAGSLEVSNQANIQAALDSLESLNVDFVKIYDSRISGENYLEVIKSTGIKKFIF